MGVRFWMMRLPSVRPLYRSAVSGAMMMDSALALMPAWILSIWARGVSSVPMSASIW